MATVQLSHLDAKLTYLALQYHLARPGSELDPETKQPVAHGLTEVAQALEPQLQQAAATVELSEYQCQRLLLAIGGAMNELRTYPLLDPLPAERSGGRRTAMPGFDAVLRQLFPEVEKGPEEAAQLSAHLMALRRGLESAAGAASPAGEGPGPGRRRWWRFWEGKGA